VGDHGSRRARLFCLLPQWAVCATPRTLVPLFRRIGSIAASATRPKVLKRFAVTVRDEVELEEWTGELLNVVNETVQPTSVGVWLRAAAKQGDRFK